MFLGFACAERFLQGSGEQGVLGKSVLARFWVKWGLIVVFAVILTERLL
jgi:hypothetical protein